MFTLLRFLSPLLGAERAHDIAVALLRLLGKVPGAKWMMRKLYAVEDPALEREVFGIHFRNPIGMAAGFDRNGEVFNELAALGFGFVEIGTITPQPQTGNPKPRVFRLPDDVAIMNRIGLNNKGLDKAISNILQSFSCLCTSLSTISFTICTYTFLIGSCLGIVIG